MKSSGSFFDYKTFFKKIASNEEFVSMMDSFFESIKKEGVIQWIGTRFLGVIERIRAIQEESRNFPEKTKENEAIIGGFLTTISIAGFISLAFWQLTIFWVVALLIRYLYLKHKKNSFSGMKVPSETNNVLENSIPGIPSLDKKDAQMTGLPSLDSGSSSMGYYIYVTIILMGAVAYLFRAEWIWYFSNY